LLFINLTKVVINQNHLLIVELLNIINFYLRKQDCLNSEKTQNKVIEL